MNNARRLVVVGLFVGLLFVYARLIEHHYYHLTWTACARGATADLCGTWRMQGVIEGLIVLGVAIGAWIYFGKARGTIA
jgi:hypothetical protein